jgi:hypothetical protein
MRFLTIIAVVFIFSSCASRLGDLTMISTRNVDSGVKYVELKRSVKGKSKDLETAIEKAVKQVPGGEFMKNVVIYYNGKIKVEGDVWGVSGVLSEKDQRESDRKSKEDELSSMFSVGDKVSWRTITRSIESGVISGKDESKAIVSIEGSDKLARVSYAVLTKIE